jgi:hypothetical protein
MSDRAFAKGTDRTGHLERRGWSDRCHDDNQDAPWQRGGPGPHMRWDTEGAASDRDGSHWLRDRPDRAWDHQDGDCRDGDHRDWDGADELIALLGGAAISTGDVSASTGLVETMAWDKGVYSIAMGEAVFEASAWSAEPGDAVAVADVFLEIAGADFIFQREIKLSASGCNQAWAYSEIDYFAIDFDVWSPRHGPIVVEFDASLELEPYRVETPLVGLAGALAAAAAQAYGAQTLSATFIEALAVENQFSLVQAMGLVAV